MMLAGLAAGVERLKNAVVKKHLAVVFLMTKECYLFKVAVGGCRTPIPTLWVPFTVNRRPDVLNDLRDSFSCSTHSNLASFSTILTLVVKEQFAIGAAGQNFCPSREVSQD